MKNLRLIVFTALLVTALTVPTTYASGVETSGSASVDILSSYVWRGIQVHEDIAIQPSVGITYGGFGANFWADYNTDNDVQEAIETDLTLNYAFSAGKVGLDVGYIYYAFDGFNDTQELYVAAGYDALLSPALTLYWDIDEGTGGFAVASIGHSFSFMHEKAGLNLGASVSYNIENEIMGADEEGDEFSNFYNGELTASASYSVTNDLSVEPKIAFSFPLSDDAKDAIEALSDNGDSSQFYGGIALSLNF